MATKKHSEYPICKQGSAYLIDERREDNDSDLSMQDISNSS